MLSTATATPTGPRSAMPTKSGDIRAQRDGRRRPIVALEIGARRRRMLNREAHFASLIVRPS